MSLDQAAGPYFPMLLNSLTLLTYEALVNLFYDDAESPPKTPFIHLYILHPISCVAWGTIDN